MDWEYLKKNNKWRWLFFAACIPCFLSLISFLATNSVICEMAASFRFQYFITLLLLSVPFFAVKRWKPGAGLLLFSLINFTQFGPLYLKSEVNILNGKIQNRKIISFNVHTANKDYTKTVEFLIQQDPDYISLIEVTPEWETRILQHLSSKYPFHISQARRDNFGVMFLSKYKLSGEVHSFQGIPYIEANCDNSCSVFTIHPVPPLNKSFFLLRNAIADDIAEKVNAKTGLKIICGDFNMTPWSPQFASLLNKTSLKNSGQGFGVSPTWPASPAILRIPLDHCLVSKSIKIDSKSVGPNLGSDHLPLIINYSFVNPGVRQ
jgi:endonuclease/exonuclease/phosphatase (EEP) superfamily protein YafD